MSSFPFLFHDCAKRRNYLVVLSSTPFSVTYQFIKQISAPGSFSLTAKTLGSRSGRVGVSKTLLRDIYTWPWMMSTISSGGNGHSEETFYPKAQKYERGLCSKKLNSLGMPRDWMSREMGKDVVRMVAWDQNMKYSFIVCWKHNV